MEPDMYPWSGEFITGDPSSPVAVVTLAKELHLPGEKVAIHGKMKTENLGIEKVMANVISNPNIRFVIVFGEEIRGHRAGGSLLALHEHGLDELRKIRNAPGAVPYIENLNDEAVARFREQVEMIDLLNITDIDMLQSHLDESVERNPGTFGEPFIALQTKRESTAGTILVESLALHNSLIVDPFLEVGNLARDQSGIMLHRSFRLSIKGRVGSAS